ncbi:hypothetical protein [Thermococcus sp.]|uniref:hypothetical protein n=1 Tax=Thermococcus sp. TaxID=35749 RepID=UPI00263683B4|nr:hypothetical protein [Thermococcus sp.]MCD6142952.1 hypothetical protein [Thermococcus sp.]
MEENDTQKMQADNYISRFIDILNKIFPGKIGRITDNQNSIEIAVKIRDEEIKWELEKAKVIEIFTRIDNLELSGSAIYDKYYYEVPVKIATEEIFFPWSYYLERILEEAVSDSAKGLTYSLGKLSDEYLVSLLLSLEDAKLLKQISRYMLSRMFRLSRNNKEMNNSVLEFLKYNLPPAFRYTLKIASSKQRKFTDFEEIADSFLFIVSYNYNLPLIRISSFEEFQRIRGYRIKRTKKLVPPRRKYKSDLVYYYQMALSTTNPLLQFISYYHIIEFFFEIVYIEDIIALIKNEITRPNFIYDNEEDLRKLYKKLEDKFKIQAQQNKSEFEALKLTLMKYLDLYELKQSISQYSPELLEYYKTEKIPFLEDKDASKYQLNFDEINENIDEKVRKKFVSKLAIRLYRVRNAVVHSKDSYKLSKGQVNKLERYVPFKHDKDLQKELPLIRCISEQIIIGSATKT